MSFCVWFQCKKNCKNNLWKFNEKKLILLVEENMQKRKSYTFVQMYIEGMKGMFLTIDWMFNNIKKIKS